MMRRTALFAVAVAMLIGLLLGQERASAQTIVNNYTQLQAAIAAVADNGTGAIRFQAPNGGNALIDVTDDLFIIAKGRNITFDVMPEGLDWLFDTSNSSPLLSILDDSNVTFENTYTNTTGFGLYVFQNARREGSGAAILLAGTDASKQAVLTFDARADFFRNTASENGGAISATIASLSFNGYSTTFQGNTAETGYGGAIYSGTTTSLTFNSDATIFRNNQAVQGGAIYATDGSTYTFQTAHTYDPDVDFVLFENNRALSDAGVTGNGGAILARLGASMNFKLPTRFSDNSGAQGGAIHLNEGFIAFGSEFMALAHFEGNAAATTDLVSGHGGAIYVNGTAPTGAGTEADPTVRHDGIVTLSGWGVFTDNRATGEGGAIYIGNYGVVNLNPGGVHQDQFGNDVINNIDFYGNLAHSANGSAANSIHLAGGILNLNPTGTSNVRFYDPISGSSGTVNMTGGGSVMFWGESLFEGNTNVNNGVFALKEMEGVYTSGKYGVLGSGTFTVNQHGTLELNVDNVLAAQTVVLVDGTVNVLWNGNDIDTTEGIRLDTAASSVVGSGSTFNVHGGAMFRLDNYLTGTGNLLKKGTGILTLDQHAYDPEMVNDFTGETIIEEGTIETAANDLLTQSKILRIRAGAEFRLYHVDPTTQQISDTDQHLKALAGDAATQVSAAATIRFDDGVHVPAEPNKLTITEGVLRDEFGNVDVFYGTITGHGILEMDSDDTDRLLILAGGNTYTGGTVLEHGTIVLAHPEALAVYNGTTQGLVAVTNDRNDYQPRRFALPDAIDLGIQNRFAVLDNGYEPLDFDDPYKAATETLFDAQGGTLTIGGNRTDNAIALHAKMYKNSPTTSLSPDGGAFFITAAGQLKFEQENAASKYLIAGNTVSGKGGAIYYKPTVNIALLNLNDDYSSDTGWNENGGYFYRTVYGADLTIRDNAAFDGGGIYVDNGYMVINSGTKVINNYATNLGGGLYARQATVGLTSLNPSLPIVFEGNQVANGRPNAVYLDQSTLILNPAIHHDVEYVLQENDYVDIGPYTPCEIHLFDPIESDTTGSSSVSLYGGGTVRLRGKYASDYFGFFGTTSLVNGELVLEQDATFGGLLSSKSPGAGNMFQLSRYGLDDTSRLSGYGTVSADTINISDGTLAAGPSLTLKGGAGSWANATLSGEGMIQVDGFIPNISGTLTLSNNEAQVLEVDAAMQGSAAILKTGTGSITLLRNVTTSGTVTAAAGTLGVGSANQTSVLTTTSQVLVKGKATLAVAAGSQVFTAREFVQENDAVLSVGISDTPAVSASTARLHGGTLNISGFTGSIDDPRPKTIIKTVGGISGDFTNMLVAGRVYDETSFMTVSAVKSDDERDYLLDLGLAWYAKNNLSHGTFQIAAENTFTLGVDLKNAVSFSPWDGKTLTKTGAGTLVLAGTNSYIGGTHVKEGVLAGDTLSLQGTINIETNAWLRFVDIEENRDGTGVFQGTIMGNGSLETASDLIIRSDLEHYGMTLVSTGNFSLTGNAVTSDFLVTETGKLHAAGTIRSLNVQPGGSVSGGEQGKTGTLIVHTGAMFSAGSNYHVDVADDGSTADKIGVLGSASVDGINVTISGGADLTAIQYSYDIITAGSLFGPGVTSWTSDIAGYNADVFTSGNAVVLTLVDRDFTFSVPAQTFNQKSVARELDRIVRERTYYGNFFDTLRKIRNMTPDQARAAYNQLTGSVKADGMMLGQWDVGRPVLTRLELETIENRRPNRSRNNYWIDPFHQASNAYSDPNSRPYGIARTGFIMGVDRRYNRDMVAGLVFGFSNPTLKMDADRVEARDFQVGAYIGQRLPLGAEFKGYVGFGLQGYDSERHLSDPLLVTGPTKLKASYQGDSFDASLEILRRTALGRWFSLTPIAALDILTTTQGGNTESGDSVLAGDYDRVRFGRALIRAGARLRYENDYSSLFFQMFYSVKFAGEDAPETKFRFVGAPGDAPMTVRGVDPGSSYLGLGCGLRFYLNTKKTRQLMAHYDLSVANQLDSNTGSLGFIQLF